MIKMVFDRIDRRNSMITDEHRIFLKEQANEARKLTLQAIYHYGRGHIGGTMSITELLVALYFEVMRVDPENPRWPDRDRLVVSKGHAAPIVYSLLSMKGYFERERLLTLNANGTALPSHCDMQKVPGIDMTTGSLGQGLSAAVGMAIANRIDQRNAYVYAIVGDGESQEGQIWEAVMLAAQLKLDHLILFVDDNNAQADGFTTDINQMRPFDLKFEAFGWHTIVVEDGHDFDQLLDAISQAKQLNNRPHAVILKTIKAKAVIGAENTYESHCYSITEEQLQQSIKIMDVGVQHIG
jgi:transketolase